MKVLVAEDELVTRLMVQVSLENWGYDVLEAKDGKEAMELFGRGEAPRIAIIDWEMPEVDGLEVCKRLREQESENPPYIILLTAHGSKNDILLGFDAGADDYITKPFNSDELRARVRVADRLVRSQDMLASTVTELKNAINQLDTLQDSLTVCEKCHKIEDIDEGTWHDYLELIEKNGEDRFIKTICPECEGKK
ncbi:response regulator transcription factor [Desulfotalea psychrophila]|nr:response regulator transcription factor [Desulfotalea psychrophila]